MIVGTAWRSCHNLKITYTSFSHYYTNWCCFIFIRIIIGLTMAPLSFLWHHTGVLILIPAPSAATTSLRPITYMSTVLVYPRTRPLVLSRHTYFIYLILFKKYKAVIKLFHIYIIYVSKVDVYSLPLNLSRRFINDYCI